MPAGSFSQLYLRHIYPPGTQIIRRCCVCVFQPPTSLAELWQHARRMVLTPTFPSFFYPTRRPPPRGELPPKRETSTQNSTRGKTRKWLKWQRRSEDVHWHPPPHFLSPQIWFWFLSGGVLPEKTGPVCEEQRLLHEQREGAYWQGVCHQR